MFPEFGLFRVGSLVCFPSGQGLESRQLGRGGWRGNPLPVPAETGTRGPTLKQGFGPSSRSLRAERWRRRKRRRRRGRCSQHGQEPCQEKTTSQLSPSIPAAVRTVTGPRALLPPLSPHLGPIVWLGALDGDVGEGRGGSGDRERKRKGGKTRRKRGSRVGTGGGGGGEGGKGSPALRGLSEK